MNESGFTSYSQDATYGEIHSQAESCAETVARAGDRLRSVTDLLPFEQYSDIILTGCGSSYNLANCASFAWDGLLGMTTRAAPSSELLFHPESYLNGSKPLVVAISRTGATTEVQLAVERLRSEHSARALAITGMPGSPVGEACDAELAFTECPEDSVVMTQAFTCMLVGLYLIADGASKGSYADELAQIPSLIAAALPASEPVMRHLGEQDDIDAFFFLGSSLMKGLADECALKVTEMALQPALSHRSLEFRHGPKAALNEHSQVIIFPTSAERPHLATLLAEIKETRASTLLVGDAPGLGHRRSEFLSMDERLSEIFRPALYAHLGQLLGYWRARSKGLNPDSPRHLARTVLLEA
jgi:glucosamine--fructose-6-phosphate aminotransferase (isomerizing)